MMEKRQNNPWLGDPDRLVVRTLGLRYAKNYEVAPHRHSWDQLIYASQGVMTVLAEGVTWVVPPHRAYWVPAGTDHGITMNGSVFLKTLYLLPGLSAHLPEAACTVNVAPLMRELILHVVELGMLCVENSSHLHLLHVLLDQLQHASGAPLQLPMPSDPRAKKVANLLLKDPSQGCSLAQLAQYGGASKRTLERLFSVQTNLTLGKWRERARLLHALRLLAAGESVTGVAMEVGYQNASSFIAAFRRAFGTTPFRYYR